MTSAMCLALVLYYEAQMEDLNGQIAVAWVVRNSAQTLYTHPRSVCKEVFSGRYVGVNDGYKSKLPKGKKWKEVLQLSKRVLDGKVPDITKGAIAFECTKWKACDPNPYWSVGLEYAGQFGSQKFWRKAT